MDLMPDSVAAALCAHEAAEARAEAAHEAALAVHAEAAAEEAVAAALARKSFVEGLREALTLSVLAEIAPTEKERVGSAADASSTMRWAVDTLVREAHEIIADRAGGRA